eukprot:symbB.v1.2.012417.t1/scaffold831.1/size159220/13
MTWVFIWPFGSWKGPKPGSGGSWPFLEDYEGNSSCSSDEAIVKRQPRPPGFWQPKASAWPPWNQSQYVSPGSWVPPTGSPGAWVPPVASKVTPKLPSEAEKLDPDLKDLLYGRAPFVPGPPPPGPPPASPFEPRTYGIPGSILLGVYRKFGFLEGYSHWKVLVGVQIN